MLPIHLGPAAPPAIEVSTRAGFRARLAGWWGRVRQERRRRATVRALEGLSDATLKDIGIDRSEIHSVAANPADERRRTRWWRGG
jgi:uncharacterized protein YjiS (DUF1127 family)